MKRKLTILAIAAMALVPVFMVQASSAGATKVNGCVHWNEFPGPYGAFVINAYNRCNGQVIRRKPDVIGGPDGACKRMIPNHFYQWQLWSAYVVPFTAKVPRFMHC